MKHRSGGKFRYASETNSLNSEIVWKAYFCRRISAYTEKIFKSQLLYPWCISTHAENQRELYSCRGMRWRNPVHTEGLSTLEARMRRTVGNSHAHGKGVYRSQPGFIPGSITAYAVDLLYLHFYSALFNKTIPNPKARCLPTPCAKNR